MVYDLIIIGADSAGLTAGIYAGRKKMNTLTLTKKIGGQSLLTDNIENYPGFLRVSGVGLVSNMKKQVEKYGIPIKENEEVVEILKKDDKFLVKTSKEEHETSTVIIATGQHWKELKVPGEKEFIGRGVSTCAICDAPFYDGKEVAIVGGGNSAFDSAYDLLKYANKIYIVHHSEKFKGDKIMHEKLLQSGKVEFLTLAETKEIKGDKFVESLVYEDLSASGGLASNKKELKVSGVFINIGQIPNSSFTENFLKLNEYKEIITDKHGVTSVPGVFAAGDVTDVKYKQNIIAAAAGAKAALSAYGYLSGK